MRKRFVGHRENMIDTHKLYWEWTTVVIDFSEYQDKRCRNASYDWDEDTPIEKRFDGDGYKLERALATVGTPDDDTNTWYNGGWSSEYNKSLNDLLDLGLIEIVHDELDDEEENDE